MNKLILFRIFALFPFIGIAMPDVADALHNSFSLLSAAHIIIDITLALCIIACSAGIWLVENQQLKTAQ